MKNKKWLTYTLGILLTLVVLTAVAGVGFRVGMTQNASFARMAFAHNFNGGPQVMQGNAQSNNNSLPSQGNFQDNNPQFMMQGQGNFHGNGGPQSMQGNFHGQGFDNRGNDRNDRRGGMSFFSPIFGLIRLAVLGALLWLGYTFVKKSGWKLTRVQATPAPVEKETPIVEVEEKKETE